MRRWRGALGEKDGNRVDATLVDLRQQRRGPSCRDAQRQLREARAQLVDGQAKGGLGEERRESEAELARDLAIRCDPVDEIGDRAQHTPPQFVSFPSRWRRLERLRLAKEQLGAERLLEVLYAPRHARLRQVEPR